MKSRNVAVASLLLALLAGCATVPNGPTVMALPGTGKNFDQFRADDVTCRDYAQAQVGSSANQAADNAGVRSAVIGTAVGALAGAALGGHEGAGVGAGAGLLMGSAAGTGAAESSARGTQNQYDNAYVQCMYAKGERVPVSTSAARSMEQAPMAPPQPQPSRIAPPPPPPPGY